MSALQDPPIYDTPVKVEAKQVGNLLLGKFSAIWLNWLITLKRALDDLLQAQPIWIQGAPVVAGPGPVDNTVNFTMRRAGTISIFASVVQNWVTAQPTWRLDLLVDGVIVQTVGPVTIWQVLASPAFIQTISAGTHSVTLRWTTGSANATLFNYVLQVIPYYS